MIRRSASAQTSRACFVSEGVSHFTFPVGPRTRGEPLDPAELDHGSPNESTAFPGSMGKVIRQLVQEADTVLFLFNAGTYVLAADGRKKKD